MGERGGEGRGRGILTLSSLFPPHKKTFFHLQFGQKENIHEHSLIFLEYLFERRAYLFVLKTVRYPLSLQAR